jgi:hypothetical protein
VPRVIVCDVNETLLDVGALEPHFRPAHPDVRHGLQTMRDAGLRLVTLTNSAPAAVQQQLTNAGLTAFFEGSFSVDTVIPSFRIVQPSHQVETACSCSRGWQRRGRGMCRVSPPPPPQRRA